MQQVSAELQRQLHDERVAVLRSSRQRPSYTPRRTLGTFFVSLGLRLAPDALPALRRGTATDLGEVPPRALHGARASFRVVS